MFIVGGEHAVHVRGIENDPSPPTPLLTHHHALCSMYWLQVFGLHGEQQKPQPIERDDASPMGEGRIL